jgi:hypothetical protein
MGESEQEQPFSPLNTQQEDNKSWLPMVIGAFVVLAIVGGVVLLTRSGRPAASNPSDPNLKKLQVSQLHMATAQNFAGGSVTYIEGKITNGSDRKVTAARVEVIFKNALGEIAQDEKTLPVTVLLPNVPYVDYGPIDRAPLNPGQTRDFRLTLEHVTADWDGQVPQVKVVGIGY